MKKFSRKLVAFFTMLALVLQLFAPAITFAQSAQTQKAEIEKATAEFQKTYDAIKAIKPLELGGLANFTIGAIDWGKSAWNDVKGFFSGESKEEREARKKQEEYNKYKAQIDKANADIIQLKADAEATMQLLKSGEIQKAANTDPTKVYNSLDKNSSALGIYQKALQEAGQKLLDIGDKIAAAGTVIGLITAVLVPIAVLFPLIAPAVPVFKGISLAITIAGGVVKAAGNTLITAAEKAITDDKQFVEAAIFETTLQTVDTAAGIVMGKAGVGPIGSAISDTIVGGVTGSAREIYRTDAEGEDAAKIVGKEFLNAGVDAAVGAVFDAAVGGIAKNITSSVMTDAAMMNMINTGKTKADYDEVVDGVTGMSEEFIGEAVDPLKSAITDELSIDGQSEKPKASSEPSLDGNW